MSNKFRVALRVLTAINNHKYFSADDVSQLRSWFAEDGNGFEADELARLVINAEIERTKNAKDSIGHAEVNFQDEI